MFTPLFIIKVFGDGLDDHLGLFRRLQMNDFVQFF